MNEVQDNRNNIYLIGFMGTGKSTIAKILGPQLSYTVLDLDTEIENTAGCAISDIFATKGEAAFRDMETESLAFFAKKTRQVIACGGGIVLREENVTLMKESGTIILLKASPKSLLERLKNDQSRPLLQDRKDETSLEALMKKREAFYEKAADLPIVTDGKQPKEIAGEILENEKIALAMKKRSIL